MKTATSLLDEKMAMRLLKHGVLLSDKTPPITNHQALLLLAEGVLDNFVKEFKSIVKELLSGCCLDDLKATPEEMRAWFGEEAVNNNESASKEVNPPKTRGTASCSQPEREEAKEVLERWLESDSCTPASVFEAFYTLYKRATGNKAAEGAGFDDQGRCRRCGSRVSFADVTDTVVFVGDEIVKQYKGDITNRNCVKCTYPEQYRDYEHYDEEDEQGQGAARCDGEEGGSEPSPSYSSDCKEVDEK